MIQLLCRELQSYLRPVKTGSMPEAHDSRWLLLIHQIPPKPDYLRVKIWRRLQRVGAVAIKNSVHATPTTLLSLKRPRSSRESFPWEKGSTNAPVTWKLAWPV